MDKFQPATLPIPTIKALRRKSGCSKKEAIRVIESLKGGQHWLNDTYQVDIREHIIDRDWPPMWWLSIKRRDKEWIHDWRELQEIKNQLIGPENEAVELYPAESRVIDGANQYHLYCFQDPKLRLPFGMWNDRPGPARATPEQSKRLGGKQRPFK